MDSYKEVETLVKKVEIGKAIRERQANKEITEAYWNIGKLIIKAQGGKEKSKYGDALLKEWSNRLSQEYGKGYDYSNMRRFRQFYLIFPNCGAVRHSLSWTIIRTLLPIKEENKRNYYINLCIKNNMSHRKLKQVIKDNSYERLLNKPEKIDIVIPSNVPSITDNLKNPIIIKSGKNKIKSEKGLEKIIYLQLNDFFSQLGSGFTWVGNQYKIEVTPKDENVLYSVWAQGADKYDNIYNCYVVVELKLRSLKKEDKAQVEFYMDLIDKYRKEPNVKNTIGIIITKEQDKFVANYVKSDKLIPLTYEIK